MEPDIGIIISVDKKLELYEKLIILLFFCMKNQLSLRPASNYSVLFFTLFGWILCVAQLFGESPDFYNYNQFFDLTKKNGFEVLNLSRFEPGFSMLSLALTAFFTENIFIYGSIVAFALFLKGWVIGVCSINQKIFTIAAILYFFRFYPLHELTQLRSACALGLLIVGAILFWGGKKLSGILVFVVAVAFHMSVAIVIPVIFLYLSNRWLVISISLGIFSLVSVVANIVSDFAANNILVVAAYQATGFGDEAPDPFAVTLLLDWAMIAVSFLLWPRLSILMKRIVLLELIGMALFYGLLDFPAFPSRIMEAYSVFWLIFVIDGLKANILKVPIILFIGSSLAIYGYIYFFRGGFFT